MVGFEPTPEDWCLKPAPLVAPGSLDHSATSSTCAIVTGFERASILEKNRSCDPCGSRFQVYRLNHSATLSCKSPGTAERPTRESNPEPSDYPVRPDCVWCGASRRRRHAVAQTHHGGASRRRRRASANNSDGTRTRNPQIRSLIRCPLRHGVVFVCVEEQGFEPWAFRMQSGRSATELHPHDFRTQAAVP